MIKEKKEIKNILELIDQLNERLFELERKIEKYDLQSLMERVDYIEEFLSRRSRRFYRKK